MGPEDIAAISVIGGLSALGIIYATCVIPRKGKVFWLIVSLFVVATIQTVSQYFRKQFSPGEPNWWAAHVVNGICYCFLFYFANWLYVLRLFTLGHLMRYERLTKYTPPAIVLLAATNFVLYTVYVTTTGVSRTAYTVGSCALLAVALLLEVYLVVVLIRKVGFVFADNPTIVHPSMVVKAKVYLCAIVVLEIAIFVLRVFVADPRAPEGSLRVFGFVLRVLVIVDFFRDLLRCLVRRGEATNTPLYSV